MNEKYYVIYINEDGEASIDVFNKDKLEEALNHQFWGAVEFLKIDTGSRDLMRQSGLYIIKGECIVPQPEEVVTKLAIK